MSLQFNALQPAQSTVPAPAFGTVQMTQPAAHNPFFTAMDASTPRFMATYGRNQPLAKPMFLGYHGDKAVLAGSRLFVLC